MSLILLLLADCCFIMFFLQTWKRTRYLYCIHAYGELCEGMIIDITESEDAESNLFYDAVIEININNARHIFPADKPERRKGRVGEMVNVRYFKNDLTTAMVEPADKLARLVIIIGVVMVIFFVINWMWVTALTNNY